MTIKFAGLKFANLPTPLITKSNSSTFRPKRKPYCCNSKRFSSAVPSFMVG
jgi:hypothetical protein